MEELTILIATPSGHLSHRTNYSTDASRVSVLILHQVGYSKKVGLRREHFRYRCQHCGARLLRFHDSQINERKGHVKLCMVVG